MGNSAVLIQPKRPNNFDTRHLNDMLTYSYEVNIAKTKLKWTCSGGAMGTMSNKAELLRTGVEWCKKEDIVNAKESRGLACNLNNL